MPSRKYEYNLQPLGLDNSEPESYPTLTIRVILSILSPKWPAKQENLQLKRPMSGCSPHIRLRPQVRDFLFQFCTSTVHVQKLISS
jgi:hypothetical protein